MGTQYIDTNVVIGGKYCYRVKATYQDIESNPSNTAEAIIIPYPPYGLNPSITLGLNITIPKP